MKRLLETAVSAFWGGVIGLVLILPVVFYMRTFGEHISTSHQRWAEMGAALSGIYGPILTILTFAVLMQQLRLQQQTTKHMFDQAFLQDAKADIEFYLNCLAAVLESRTPHGPKVRDVLQSEFEFATAEELKGERLQKYAEGLHYDVPSMQSLWGALYAKFAGLKDTDEAAYQLQFSSARLKTGAMLSFPTCVALDNYFFCRMGEIPEHPYQYSIAMAQD